MTEPNAEDPHTKHESPGMPRWVPVLICVLLVIMAALAVYTGLRGREDDTLLAKVRPRRVQAPETPAPSGEPEAGASLVLHGAQGEAPAANEPVQGQSRAVVTGGPDGVSAVVRIWARRGMVLNVLPDNTMVYVNNLPIGEAAQFNTMDEAYEFAAPGSYTVKLVPSSGKPGKTYVVTSKEDAPNDVARISADLR